LTLLNSINDLWLKQIEQARIHKQAVFGKTAKRVCKFCGQEYPLNVGDEDDTDDPDQQEFAAASQPRVRSMVSKTSEYVKIYLPYLHAKVPHRLVTPYYPQIPPALLGLPEGSPVPPSEAQQIDKARAWILGWLLNYLPTRVYDLRYEGRKVVIEALAKGRSCVWTEIVDAPTGDMPASFFDSVDNLFIDPDAENLRTAAWIARRRRRSVWAVADEYSIEPDKIRGAYMSRRGQAEYATTNSGTLSLQKGDVVEYYEVFSRCGLGHKFFGADEEMKSLAKQLDAFGDYTYLAICPGLDHPLSLTPDFVQSPESETRLRDKLAWPIAFWARAKNPWPMTPLDFYPDVVGCWARSPLEPALPLQEFIDKAYAYLSARLKVTSRDLVVVAAEMEQALKTAIENGFDLEVVTMKGRPGQELKSLVDILQFPGVNKDIYPVIQMAERAFEMSTGMTELQYGVSGAKQIRSSAEAQIRQSNTSIRPDDMAECVEDFMSSVAEAEAGAARLHVPGKAIAPLFGENPELIGPATALWDQMVATQDPIQAFSEMAYSVEAGSGRRRNKAKQVQDANDFAQYLMPLLMQHYQRTGDPTQVNAYMRMWCEASDIDPTNFLLQRLPPPPPPGPPQGAPGGASPQQRPQGPPQGGPPGMPPNIPPELMQQIMAAQQMAGAGMPQQ